MKLSQKSVLINLIIAVLLTGGSWFIKITPFSFDAITVYRGLPFGYWSQTHATYDFGTGNFPTFSPHINWFVVVADVTLWFLIITFILFVVKKFSKKKNS